jgi:hypothetical protein
VSRRIQVEVDGAVASFVLLEEWAPRTTAILWDILTLERLVLRHGKLSGDACFFVAEDPRLQQLPAENELAVTSIYKGYMWPTCIPIAAQRSCSSRMDWPSTAGLTVAAM